MLTIVIPTYWTWPQGQTGKRGDLVFDHPTPLDGEDTLSASLKSLSELDEKVQVILITATVNHELDQAVEARVEELMKPYKKIYPLSQFAASDLEFLRSRLTAQGLNPMDISLEGYSAIRNCQLLAPLLLDSDIVSAIDDDELVDPDFSKKARDFVGKKHRGTMVDGVAGRYFYEWGSYRVIEPKTARSSKNVFYRKHALQNDSYDLFDSREGRLVDTSITLGGNMVFSDALCRQVPFDPRVTRGEDIDYMINSMMYGYRWMMDKELVIYHYPPPCNAGHKLQEDVIRFVYEKRKLQYSRERQDLYEVSADILKPYPGEFFTDRLEGDALEALSRRSGLKGDEHFFMRPEEVLAEARDRSCEAEEYFSYVQRWREITAFISEDHEAKERMRSKMGL